MRRRSETGRKRVCRRLVQKAQLISRERKYASRDAPKQSRCEEPPNANTESIRGFCWTLESSSTESRSLELTTAVLRDARAATQNTHEPVSETATLKIGCTVTRAILSTTARARIQSRSRLACGVTRYRAHLTAGVGFSGGCC